MIGWRRMVHAVWMLVIAVAPRFAGAVGFDEANRLYENGEFSASALQYRELIRSGQESAAVWFNLGNALLKDGEAGRGIYSYRRAIRLSPRDPDARANLMFARKEVAGAFAPETSSWSRFFRYLSPTEWIWFAAIVLCLCFSMMALREINRSKFAGFLWPIRLGWGCALLVGVLSMIAHSQWDDSGDGVIVVDKVVARYGPLDDSKQFFQLKNGEEVKITGRKNQWVQVVNTSGQSGWVRADQLLSIADDLPALKS